MRQWTVDAFASRPFHGNPACVVEPLETWPADDWMRALAMENNQAETAFLRRTEAPDRFDLRWFTPAVEVPLCGHATLAASHVLLSELGVDAAELTYQTRSGPLTVRRAGERYQMDFPANPPRLVETPEALAGALGAEPLEVWTADRVVVVLADEATVRGLRPDVAALQVIASGLSDTRANLGVTAPADPGRPYDLVSRYFAPGSGIREDPVTGGYHCSAAPLFADKLGRAVLRFHQAYPGRGGDLECEIAGARVLLRGEAVTVAESHLRL